METQRCVQSFGFLTVNVCAVENCCCTACLLVIEHLSELVLCRRPLGLDLYFFFLWTHDQEVLFVLVTVNGVVFQWLQMSLYC